jgi:hypothetical protein
LSAIGTTIEGTKQFKYARYAVDCLNPDAGHVEHIVEQDRCDYAMELLLQFNLANTQEFQKLDLDSTYRLLAENRDVLGLLKFLEVLSPVSQTAKSAVSAWQSFDWASGKTLMSRIGSEIQAEVVAKSISHDLQPPPLDGDEGYEKRQHAINRKETRYHRGF